MSQTRKFEELIQSLAVLDTRKKVEMAKMLIRQNPEMLKWNLRKPYCTFCKETVSGTSCNRHKVTIPADNSMEYVLIVYNLATKIMKSGDFLLDMIEFFKDRGITFDTKIKGPFSKFASNAYSYVSWSFNERKSPIHEKKLSTSQRAIVGCVMMAIKVDSKPVGSRRSLLVVSNGGDEEYIDATPQKNKRRSTTQSSYQPVIDQDTPPKRLRVVSNGDDEFVSYSQNKRRSVTNESSYQPVIKQDTMPKRVRYDSGRGSLKSPSDVKVENRSPPQFAESVGSKVELTPDEFYAHSLRLDFPRSTLGS